MTNAFGEELRRLRERAELSLADLAARVNYSKSHLGNVERGRKHATRELAERCDATLGADGHLIGLVPAQSEAAQTGRQVKPAQLPAASSYFAGRDTPISRLNAALAAAQSRGSTSVIVIDGMPGVGKTALAIRWAHDQAAHFPDGSLYADLHAHSAAEHAASPEDVLELFLRTLGVPASAIPDGLIARSVQYRSQLDGRRMLIVLDNAATSDQVRPLLPGSAGSLVVVTSRSRLSGLVVREDALRLTLKPLRPEEAISLLRNLLGVDRIDAEPEASTQVAERCAYLPLALRIAAERATARSGATLSELAAALDDERERLNVLAIEGDESSALRTVFSWSYQELPVGSAHTFRLLSAHPGSDITPPAAAALTSVSSSNAVNALEHLASAHLLDEHRPGRYRLPPLLRAYAAECLDNDEPASERTAAQIRVIAWYLHTAAVAAGAIDPHQRRLLLDRSDLPLEPPPFVGREEALKWCDVELDNLVAATRASAGSEQTMAWQLPLTLGAYFDLRKGWQSWITTHHIGLSAARQLGNRAAEAWLLTNLAKAYTDLRRLDQARDLLEESLAIQREVGDQHGEALSLLQLGHTYRTQTRFDKALARYREALQILPAADDQHGVATALVGVAEVYSAAGQHQQAREPAETALAIFHRLGDRRGEGMAVRSLAITYHDLGYRDEALAEIDRALQALRDIDDRHAQAIVLHRRGHILHELGRADAATSSWREALATFEILGDDRAADLRVLLHGRRASSPMPNEAG